MHTIFQPHFASETLLVHDCLLVHTQLRFHFDRTTQSMFTTRMYLIQHKVPLLSAVDIVQNTAKQNLCTQ